MSTAPKSASKNQLSQVQMEEGSTTVKVTLLISEPIVIEAKKLALDQRTTLSKLTEDSLKAAIQHTNHRS